ncbi:hypothetical protein TWF506_011110 [Arthrobotrys conoides]|uniref:Uncharacterized protein n=1 Tax=Arthrobotrys conoides TaxID=74498 RepID=A0AAN8N9Z8_9PEZI
MAVIDDDDDDDDDDYNEEIPAENVDGRKGSGREVSEAVPEIVGRQAMRGREFDRWPLPCTQNVTKGVEKCQDSGTKTIRAVGSVVMRITAGMRPAMEGDMVEMGGGR